MYSYNSNLEEQFAKSRSASKALERESNRTSKIQLQSTRYLRGLNPPPYEWFGLGSIKKKFFSPRRVYSFMMDTGGCVRYYFISGKAVISRWSHPEHLENIAEIIAKKRAEDALFPVTSKAR